MGENELYCLWLTLIPGIGPATAKKIIKKYGSAGDVFDNRNELFNDSEKIELAFNKAKAIQDECDKKKIDLISYDNDKYLNKWREYTDFPMVLYTKGQNDLNLSNCVGIVGARRCTNSGKLRAISCSEKEVDLGNIIVSGMAKGIDSYAHTACIKHGGKTVAVLGNGIDICYPKEHIGLYEAICESGMILSEYPPGVKAQKYNFPKRNRIIAGLCQMIYVIEAGKNSGTRTTIDAALKYGRKVECISCYEYDSFI